jgi:nucleoside-diphosphate-sugar epimerase
MNERGDLKLLVTGASGKVGRNLIERILKDSSLSNWSIRAFSHRRPLSVSERVEVVQGTVSSQDDVSCAIEGISHVVHLATCKETQTQIMEVAIKGLFWILEECRQSSSFKRIVIIGGDSAMGHFFYPHPVPVTESQKRTPYPGCYALSKVLEEVMLEQYYVQYGLDGCCLRAPWIMEKDDLRYALSFGKDVFGGPKWWEYVGEELAEEYQRAGKIPLMQDENGRPIKRNVVHVKDLVEVIVTALDHPSARQQLFNVCMDEPLDYGEVASYLAETKGLESIPVKTEFHSNWMDNTKAKFLLGWRPRYDYRRMLDSAWEYVREPDDTRVVWYPG